MARKLFCELGSFAYMISYQKEVMKRRVQNRFSKLAFAKVKSEELLEVVVYRHQSLIRRKLGNVDLQLQENKAVNLASSTPKMNHVLIRPNEVFSLWELIGKPSKRKGYQNGLTISGNQVKQGIGGGMCQLSNLIHWMVLHSSLTICEHHHHGQFDLFPDYGRKIPFGTGTSIVYNYLDYRFKNETPYTFQLVVYTDEEYLYGELRCDVLLPLSYHIYQQDGWFTHEEDGVYRHNIIRIKANDRKTGNVVFDRELIRNDAKVMYDEGFIDRHLFR